MPNWILGIAVTKAIKRVVQLILAYLLAQNLSQYGIQIVDEKQLTLAIYAVIEIIRNWVKQTFKVTWL